MNGALNYESRSGLNMNELNESNIALRPGPCWANVLAASVLAFNIHFLPPVCRMEESRTDVA
jgi:hypothetical protein